MSQAAKFLFDLDFSAPPEPEVEEEIEEIPPEPMITVAEHEQILEIAKKEAFAAGQVQAMQEREQSAIEKTQEIQQAILDDVSMVYAEVGTLMQRLERDASQLAFAFASRFAERLVAQEPKVEIQALLNQILAPLRKTPHITIRVEERVADEIRKMVEMQMEELGFEGKLVVLADPMVMAGDCEVEWADGGIGRNMRSAIRQVEQLLEDHFAHVPEDPDEPEDDEEETDASNQEETAQDPSEQEEASEADLDQQPEPTNEAELIPEPDAESASSQEPEMTAQEVQQPEPQAKRSEPEISPEVESDIAREIREATEKAMKAPLGRIEDEDAAAFAEDLSKDYAHSGNTKKNAVGDTE